MDVGLSKNYPVTMPLCDALKAHREWAASQFLRWRVRSIEISIANAENDPPFAFYTLTAWGRPRAALRRTLAEFDEMLS